jgi:hypothetical protein
MQTGNAVKALIMFARTRLGARSLLLEAFAISTLFMTAQRSNIEILNLNRKSEDP